MKTWNSWVIVVILLVVPVTLGGLGCGGPLEYVVHGTPTAPESDWKIIADVDKSQAMTRLEIEIEHLAEPGRFAEGGKVFVAWARPDDDSAWQRIGSLEYDDDDREGFLKQASVPMVSFELTVSVEEKVGAEVPSGTIVLTQKVND